MSLRNKLALLRSSKKSKKYKEEPPVDVELATVEPQPWECSQWFSGETLKEVAVPQAAHVALRNDRESPPNTPFVFSIDDPAHNSVLLRPGPKRAVLKKDISTPSSFRCSTSATTDAVLDQCVTAGSSHAASDRCSSHPPETLEPSLREHLKSRISGVRERFASAIDSVRREPQKDPSIRTPFVKSGGSVAGDDGEDGAESETESIKGPPPSPEGPTVRGKNTNMADEQQKLAGKSRSCTNDGNAKMVVNKGPAASKSMQDVQSAEGREMALELLTGKGSRKNRSDASVVEQSPEPGSTQTHESEDGRAKALAILTFDSNGSGTATNLAPGPVSLDILPPPPWGTISHRSDSGFESACGSTPKARAGSESSSDLAKQEVEDEPVTIVGPEEPAIACQEGPLVRPWLIPKDPYLTPDDELPPPPPPPPPYYPANTNHEACIIKRAMLNHQLRWLRSRWIKHFSKPALKYACGPLTVSDIMTEQLEYAGLIAFEAQNAVIRYNIENNTDEVYAKPIQYHFSLYMQVYSVKDALGRWDFTRWYFEACFDEWLGKGSMAAANAFKMALAAHTQIASNLKERAVAIQEKAALYEQDFGRPLPREAEPPGREDFMFCREKTRHQVWLEQMENKRASRDLRERLDQAGLDYFNPPADRPWEKSVFED